MHGIYIQLNLQIKTSSDSTDDVENAYQPTELPKISSQLQKGQIRSFSTKPRESKKRISEDLNTGNLSRLWNTSKDH